MIRQLDLGPTRFAQLRALAEVVRRAEITLGGNQPGKIYGRLDCRAGKRMKGQNRVFFRNKADAVAQGFRPCGVCLPTEYAAWKRAFRHQ